MNSYGKLFRVNIYGESHQEEVGILVDGVKPGIKLDDADFLFDLERRKPKSNSETLRKEIDEVSIRSGVFNGYTTGSPILLSFKNNSTNSIDYDNISYHPRPSHADFVARVKYNNYNDYRGGGRFSGRLTVGLVASGVIAKKMIPFKISSKIIKVGDLEDLSKLDDYLDSIVNQKDSVGGTALLRVENMIIGLGEPFFESLESEISKMMFSIPGVKGIAFGDILDISRGSNFNDAIIDKTGKTKTNHNGGINGGISNGNDIVFKVFFRPTASIYQEQDTFNFKTNKVEALSIKGRHDVFILRRALVVLENALSIVLADLYLQYLAYKE